MIEKNYLFEIIVEWNYWDRDFPKTVRRPLYEDRLKSYSKTDEVIVIKGARRAGKSTILINEMKRLYQEGIGKNSLLYINFEDPRFINYLNVELLESIKETYLENVSSNTKPSIFLDEIQNIPNWEKWILKEYSFKNFNIYITGSNSNLLSREIGTALSGRYLNIEVYPLSFKEYLLFKEIKIENKIDFISKKVDINREFQNYLSDGGFPKLVEYEEKNIKRETLKNYYDSILLRDIVARYKLKNYRVLEEISAFLLANSSTLNSISNIKNSFHISYDTARDYIEYLLNSYMLFEILKFDYSLKKQMINLKKFYSIDVGLSNIMRVARSESSGHNLENILFLELLRRGKKIYYYKTKNNLEIDFLIKDEEKITEFIQVSKTLQDSKTKKRELAPFEIAKKELKLNGRD